MSNKKPENINNHHDLEVSNTNFFNKTYLKMPLCREFLRTFDTA